MWPIKEVENEKGVVETGKESNQILHNSLENANEIFLLTADNAEQYPTSIDCR